MGAPTLEEEDALLGPGECADCCLAVGPAYADALHRAAHHQHLHCLRRLIKEGRPINALDKLGNAPLHYAAYSGNSETVRALLQANSIQVDIRDAEGNTPLHKAAFKGHLKVKYKLSRLISLQAVEELIKSGADIEARDEDGSTPLHKAACSPRSSVVKLLLKLGSKSAIRDKHGYYPLHYAVLSGQKDNLHVLLSKNRVKDCIPNVNCRDNAGNTLLHLAVEGGFVDCVSTLLHRKPEVNATNSIGATAMHLACKAGNTQLVSMLLAKGASTKSEDLGGRCIPEMLELVQKLKAVQVRPTQQQDKQEKRGVTPVHVAAWYGHMACLEAMIAKRPKAVNFVGFHGFTPLHLAAWAGKPEVVNYLQKSGAKWTEDEFQCTPFFRACASGNLRNIAAMLPASKDDKMKDKFGASPLHHCAFSGTGEACSWLLQKAEILVTSDAVMDNNGLTPLHYAAYAGNAGSLEQLLEKGAEVDARDLWGQVNVLQWH